MELSHVSCSKGMYHKKWISLLLKKMQSTIINSFSNYDNSYSVLISIVAPKSVIIVIL